MLVLLVATAKILEVKEGTIIDSACLPCLLQPALVEVEFLQTSMHLGNLFFIDISGMGKMSSLYLFYKNMN